MKKMEEVKKRLSLSLYFMLFVVLTFFSSVMEYVGEQNCIMTMLVDTQLKYIYQNLQNCIPQKVKFCTLKNKNNKMWGNPQ